MIIEDVRFDPQLIAGPAYELDQTRSPGLHLSHIYADIANTLKSREEMEEEKLNSYRAAGFLWERIFEQAFAQSIRTGKIVRPGEYMVDGIIGSPDNVDVSSDPWVVIDTKATYLSSRKWEAMEKFFWIWLVQAKGYCRMVGTTRARIVCLFINGDYRGSGPQIKQANISFSQQEIVENWSMIINHARRRGWLK